MPHISKQKFENLVDEVAIEIGVQREYLHRTLANVVLIQLLKQVSAENEIAYVKGGTGVLFRNGFKDSRFTKDLDLASYISQAEMKDLVTAIQGTQWDAFKVAKVTVMPSRTRKPVADEVRLLVYKIQINYGNSEWRTCELEVSQIEIDDPDITYVEDSEIQRMFRLLDLPQPEAMPLISVELQIAQKIHAVTDLDDDRGHDLFDIFMLLKNSQADESRIANYARDTFALRNKHIWPPVLVNRLELETKYNSEIQELFDAPSYREAFSMVEGLIARLSGLA